MVKRKRLGRLAKQSGVDPAVKELRRGECHRLSGYDENAILKRKYFKHLVIVFQLVFKMSF